MSNNLVAVNEQQINKLIFEIDDASIKIRNILNEIESLIDDTSLYYIADSASKLRSTFSNFKPTLRIIPKNILTYKSDMLKIKTLFKNQDTILSDIITKGKNKIN